MSCDYIMILDPKNFVDESFAELNDYSCPLCYGILFQPVSDSCNHFFCKKCIKIYNRTNYFCPLDPSVRLESFNNAEIIQSIINNKFIYCQARGEGCSWKGKVEKYLNHLKKCQLSNIKSVFCIEEAKPEKMNCIYDGCNEKVENMFNHLQKNRGEHELIFQHSFKMFKNEVLEKFTKLEKSLSCKRRQIELKEYITNSKNE